jgi:cytochrome c-type biogenesis protein CcmE
MKRKKIIKAVLILIVVGILTGGGVVFYMFNMPHRNVQASETDYVLNAGQLVAEYLLDPTAANEKYLDDSGDSKILEISGMVASVSVDYNSQKVVLLKTPDNKAGISCTFTQETNASLNDIKEGQHVIVKGVIRSGAAYDEDLQMYENVIMEKCDIVSKI